MALHKHVHFCEKIKTKFVNLEKIPEPNNMVNIDLNTDTGLGSLSEYI